jgi:hypothetical protein
MMILTSKSTTTPNEKETGNTNMSNQYARVNYVAKHEDLPEKYHISILNGGADTYILGHKCKVLLTHNTMRENVVGFDHETTEKRNLPIVSVITSVDLPDEISATNFS